ncbi:MAG: HIT domain-containing protein [archaeon]
MSDCVFCKIISNEIKTERLYENDNSIVILDIRPASKKGGHCLVISKKHYKSISEVDDKTLFDMAKSIKIVSKALLKFGDGLNILQNNGKEAGQLIDHVHFHIIPRFKDDNIKLHKWESYEYKEGEINKVFNKIKSLLKDINS